MSPLSDKSLWALMLLAGIGFVLSLMAHVASLLDVQIPGGEAVWLLHAGIFVVWFPAILVARKAMADAKGWPSQLNWPRIVLKNYPLWMKAGVGVLFVYAIANFVLAMIQANGRHYAGVAPPEEIRSFSGHWMAFYGTGFAVLYSFTHPRPDSDLPIR